MIIKSIVGENIFSFKELNVDLSDKTFCIVTGENRDTNDSNGSGKSSLIEIPSVVIYKKSTKKNILHDGAKSGIGILVLEVDGKDHILERELPGDRLKLDGQPITQEEVENFIGKDYNLFCNTAYYRQEFLNAFASSTPANQMKIITSQIPELEKFDVVRKSVYSDKALSEQRLSEWKARLEELGEYDENEVKALNTLLAKEQKNLKSLNSKVEWLRSEMSEVDHALDGIFKYNKMKREMADVKEQFNSIKKQYEASKALCKGRKDKLNEYNIDELRIEWDKLNAKKSEIRAELLSLEKDLKKYVHAVEVRGMCPFCMQSVSEFQRNRYVKPKIKETREKINQLDQQFNKVDSSLDNVNEKKCDYDSEKVSLDEEQFKLQNYKRNLQSLKEKFEYIKGNMPKRPPKDDHESLERHKEEIQAKYKEHNDLLYASSHQIAKIEEQIKSILRAKERAEKIKNQIKVEEKNFNVASYWHKTLPIVKVKIVDNTVSNMEAAMNQYLIDLYPSFYVKIGTSSTLKSGEVRDKLNFKIVTGEGKIREWSDLSGGEKARIALGCQMSLHQDNLGFEIYDEVFRAMDDSGIEATINLMKSRSMTRSEVGKQIIAISHNKSVCSYFEDNIHVIKENGVSRIEQ